MTALELKPCPFCGKVAHLRDDVCHSTAFFVGCETLGCFGNAQWDETQEEAVSKWNTRADLADAAVAAAYERAASNIGVKLTKLSNIWHKLFVYAGYDAFANRLKQMTDELATDVPSAIRALATDAQTDALEAVRREARNEALREAHNTAIHSLLKEIEGHLPEFGAGDPQDGTDLIIDQTWRSFRKIALSKLNTAQEDKT